MKKRRSKVTNQLPDFADDSTADLNEKLGGGFRKIFGSKATSTSGPLTGYRDLEGQPAVAPAGAGYPQDTDEDFEYRGVSNSNNLDSVFRSSGTNTGMNSGGQNSSTGSVKQQSRLNSVYNPMSTMHEGAAEESKDNVFQYPSEIVPEDQLHNLSSETEHDRSSEFELEDELFFNRQPNHLWQNQGEDHSNNSRLRFTEEI
ncbi:CIC11C00000003539 [Sungouiella intermedia]|nr:CIC11C00000003539 [[Candida] intermedia]